MDDREERLTALRDRLAALLVNPDTPAAAVAGISREYRATLAELGGVAPEVDDVVARFRQQRSPRKSGAPRKTPASGERRKPRAGGS
jgi:hypothetical protein